MLKIALEKSDENTAAFLKHYNGTGAVKLFKADDRACLLERCVPGTHLSSLVYEGKDDEATHILCDTIEKLHTNKEFSGAYRTIGELQNGYSDYLESGDKRIPFKMVQYAQEIYASFIKAEDQKIMLHGDLHHENILYDDERGWLAIDPKGYIGSSSYEVGAMLRNPLHYAELFQDTDVLQQRIEIISERLGYKPEIIRGWAYSQAVLAAIWAIEDGVSSSLFLEIATALWHK